MLELSRENFESEVVKSEGAVIVDFWAEWCDPCKEIAPVFEKLSSEYNGKLKFAKINTTENQDLAGKYGVRAIPCLVVFNKGKEVERIMGYLPEDKLKVKIDDILAKV